MEQCTILTFRLGRIQFDGDGTTTSSRRGLNSGEDREVSEDEELNETDLDPELDRDGAQKRNLNIGHS